MVGVSKETKGVREVGRKGGWGRIRFVCIIVCDMMLTRQGKSRYARPEISDGSVSGRKETLSVLMFRTTR